jgi:hypothetical protein
MRCLQAIPVVVLLAAAVGLLSLLALRYTRFGRQSIAVGAGEPAAWAAGINVDRTKIIAFALSGLLAAVAGVILAARLSSGSPGLANQLLLPVIAAVIVGGYGYNRRPWRRGTNRGRRSDHIARAHRHDLRRRKHLRREYRFRCRAHYRRRRYYRSLQDCDHQMSNGISMIQDWASIDVGAR